MEQKKAQQGEQFSGSKAFDFIGDIKAEFKKITWTSKEELKVYTKVVVFGTFAFGMLVYGADILIQSCLDGLNIALKWIAG